MPTFQPEILHDQLMLIVKTMPMNLLHAPFALQMEATALMTALLFTWSDGMMTSQAGRRSPTYNLAPKHSKVGKDDDDD
jgi:hypothetical protein